MRQTQIFSGSSHPALVDGICNRLGMKAGKAELRKFANGETSVQIQTSIRDQDVFIVQSGSEKINDMLMELLIMISACKGGSAKSVTAVMPYFPYSRQSKKKQHRGAITARMVANLLDVAGVNHVITIDLHASQMQGFFKCPVDNLIAEPLIARWIRNNVPNWREAVIVSKNPGGTKRVTSLADALKLSFGIVTTDRRRTPTSVHWGEDSLNMYQPMGMDGSYETASTAEAPMDEDVDADVTPITSLTNPKPDVEKEKPKLRARAVSNPLHRRSVNGSTEKTSSPLSKSTRVDSISEADAPKPLQRSMTAPNSDQGDEADDEYTDERARDVIHGRLIQGHIVDDSHPSPALSAVSSVQHRSTQPPSDDCEPIPDHMMSSFISNASSLRRRETSGHALGGTYDAAASSEEEEQDLKNPEYETMVTLVGNVKGKPVIILDDMIDKSGSWIAAAETVVKRGGATKVYCMATHGLFGGDCLEEMANCDCIDKIVVTDTFPISDVKKAEARDKLVVMNVENLLAEAIRRNHHGESISQLFMHID
ncbi:phosphoribosyl pyrophosphokinase [Delitschia confertaspora ATCC 74209]|uniref:Ribose-phosphate pyrophosphokinase 1 n=1 Tax=Delitschia confertaspora ATCC 74209 TaxID=1513339 RepID=A0A9P4JMB4_9PLEO|nr:phosphoribosyl pyrophosphokinase [Delitschia confertaspora ATCC 74209]